MAPRKKPVRKTTAAKSTPTHSVAPIIEDATNSDDLLLSTTDCDDDKKTSPALQQEASASESGTVALLDLAQTASGRSPNEASIDRRSSSALLISVSAVRRSESVHEGGLPERVSVGRESARRLSRPRETCRREDSARRRRGPQTIRMASVSETTASRSTTSAL